MTKMTAFPASSPYLIILPGSKRVVKTAKGTGVAEEVHHTGNEYNTIQYSFNACPSVPATVFCHVRRQVGGGYFTHNRLEFYSTQQQNSYGYPRVFGVKLFNGATSGIA